MVETTKTTRVTPSQEVPAQNLLSLAYLPEGKSGAWNTCCSGSSLSFFMAKPTAAMKDLSPRII